MAEAAVAAEAAPLHPGLPDEIVVWEILVRLPPKPLLRCRAVCPAWRRATSTRDFLLAHHARQLSLPLLCGYDFLSACSISLDVIPFDHRAGLAAVDQLKSIARLGKSYFGVRASCDGLLILCGLYRNLDYSICNPATRQHARLPQLDGFAFLGMYPHSPTGEYRLLLEKPSYAPAIQGGYYVFTLGSDQPPRRCPDDAEDMIQELSAVLFRGSLHWHVEQHGTASNMIKVFITATESFRRMRAPALPGKAHLFEMDGTLGMSSFNDAATTIDIWMTQDYESEAWALKYRVELLATAEVTVMFGIGRFDGRWSVAPSLDGDVLVLVEFGDWLIQIDMDSKVVASFQRALRCTDQLRLKQSLVPHSFFPTLDGYVVNDSPFM
ncbi:F-box protein At5g49610-like [Lolium rigidum]|uniref:F-box protein At5g49610-like n=1 Tax=Lolium rigidum TaxID=89674 RepID=UPI001F5DFBEE|nr:F-box protein At5g49610-like [Lolium rigidum]